MIPYFEQPALHLGPLSIHAYGALLALALLTGLELTRWRARRQGLGEATIERVAWYAIGFGFVGAHLYSVLAYFPERLADDPWLLLRVWENISSTGAFLGGALGTWVYLRFREGGLSGARRWLHLDAVAFSLPFAWAVGRLGCTFAHDHPGRVTEFFLARSLETEAARDYIARIYTAAGRAGDLPPSAELAGMGFHDLGWYEFLYLSLVVLPAFLWLDREERRPGFWVATFVFLYAPVRFLLDFLRVADARYWALTPAQWAALAVVGAAGAWLVAKETPGRERRPQHPAAARPETADRHRVPGFS